MADPWDRWTAVADEPLVLAAIGRARDAWLSAERIAAEAGLPVDRVRTVLETTTADVIVTHGEGPDRPARYSTRAHYRATSSMLQRYFDALMTA